MLRFLLALSLSVCCSVAKAEAPRVDIIGHRGASHDAPENTLSSVRLAFEQGADGTEIDIYLTQDGKIITSHDKSTKRTAGVERIVATSTFEELRSLDVGSWKSEKFKGEQMPTLLEVLRVLPPGKRIYIEVKAGPEIVPVMLQDLAAAALPVEQTFIIAFNAKVVAAVKQQRPELTALYLHDLKKATAEEIIATAKEIHADGVDLKAGPELDKAFASKIRNAGLRLDVWTVNTPELARQMIDVGVQGITTDRPGWLREQLAASK